jgi:hypothetical protein
MREADLELIDLRKGDMAEAVGPFKAWLSWRASSTGKGRRKSYVGFVAR